MILRGLSSSLISVSHRIRKHRTVTNITTHAALAVLNYYAVSNTLIPNAKALYLHALKRLISDSGHKQFGRGFVVYDTIINNLRLQGTTMNISSYSDPDIGPPDCAFSRVDCVGRGKRLPEHHSSDSRI